MKLIIDDSTYEPSDAVRKRIQDHGRHLAELCGEIEACRVRILPVKKHPPQTSGYVARLDIATPDGQMVIGEHAGWPASDRAGVAVERSFARANEVVRQYARQRRGEVREHKSVGHDEGLHLDVTVDGTGAVRRD
jgi:hypothetical protein